MGVRRYSGDRFALFEGDCLDVLATLPANSVDAIITDPPYGLSFMGKNWDHGIPGKPFWTAALRVAKPGAHLLAFGGTRTFHRLAVAIEDAGWEIRDTIMWVYGSGFPKSLDVSKAIDKAAGAEREVVGFHPSPASMHHVGRVTPFISTATKTPTLTSPVTDEAHQWEGWGTALKPAWEPIIVARKPLVGTVAQNVQRYGTGAINVDAARIEYKEEERISFDQVQRQQHSSGIVTFATAGLIGSEIATYKLGGRWPANLIHDGSEEVTELFPESSAGHTPPQRGRGGIGNDGHRGQFGVTEIHHDSGSAARFFYCAKADGVDRDEGLEDLRGLTRGEATNRVDGTPGINSPRAGAGRTRGGRNMHPTVKPTDLMQYLIRLVTPKGAIVLDPFMGSGSTGKAAIREGVRFIGIDLSEEYVGVAHLRILHELKRILARPTLDT